MLHHRALLICLVALFSAPFVCLAQSNSASASSDPYFNPNPVQTTPLLYTQPETQTTSQPAIQPAVQSNNQFKAAPQSNLGSTGSLSTADQLRPVQPANELNQIQPRQPVSNPVSRTANNSVSSEFGGRAFRPGSTGKATTTVDELSSKLPPPDIEPLKPMSEFNPPNTKVISKDGGVELRPMQVQQFKSNDFVGSSDGQNTLQPQLQRQGNDRQFQTSLPKQTLQPVVSNTQPLPESNQFFDRELKNQFGRKQEPLSDRVETTGATVSAKTSNPSEFSNQFRVQTSPRNNERPLPQLDLEKAPASNSFVQQDVPVTSNRGKEPFKLSNPTTNFDELELNQNDRFIEPGQSLTETQSNNEPNFESNVETSGEQFQPGQVIAIVGGDPVFVGDLIFEANQLMDRFNPNAPKKIRDRDRPMVIKRLLPNFVEARMRLLDVINDLPDEMNFDEIVESAGSEFDENVLPMIVEKSNVASAVELDGQLRLQGGSLRQLKRSWTEEQLVNHFVMKKLKVDQEVTHQQMLEHYQKDKEKYFNKAKVQWEELMVRFSKVPNRQQAMEMITSMGNEVVYGAPLEAVAKRSSHGFTSTRGGNYDWTSKGSLVYKSVENQLFSIPLNELSEVIESKDGYHIVRVLERTEESFTPFLEAQVEIRERLEAEMKDAAFKEYMTDLRQRIPVEVLLDDVEMPGQVASQKVANLK